MDRDPSSRVKTLLREDIQSYHARLPDTDIAWFERLVEEVRLGTDVNIVGYVEDLLKWVDDWYGGWIRTWTRLESFWVESRWGNGSGEFITDVEAYVRKIRPEVDFQLCLSGKDALSTTLALL
ncbi:hypothetical protein BGX29_008943 [Mortierella sp. GBA35]|nr:hypothetical protein BGX29_008943 [Mortierella sp. GBA35]